MYRSSLIPVKVSLRRCRGQQIINASAGVADGVVTRHGLFSCLCGGRWGKWVRYYQRVAVDFGKVAAFNVFLEGEGGDEGLCGCGFGGVVAFGEGGLEFAGGVGYGRHFFVVFCMKRGFGKAELGRPVGVDRCRNVVEVGEVGRGR